MSYCLEGNQVVFTYAKLRNNNFCGAHYIYIFTAESYKRLHAPAPDTFQRYADSRIPAIHKKKRHKNEKAYKKFAGRTKMLNFAIITDMHNAYGDIQGNLNHTL